MAEEKENPEVSGNENPPANAGNEKTPPANGGNEKPDGNAEAWREYVKLAQKREEEQSAELDKLRKEIETLKDKHKKDLEDAATAILEAEKDGIEKGKKAMARKLGQPLPGDPPKPAATKSQLQEQWDKVKGDVFKRAKFLKGLSAGERETLIGGK